ncbi:MAG TPA: hypothetical protein VKA67_12700, partial [Verrucomicrobiae bacterium]|nr:hypothetical protein [Verrucomicrobiae bacterium]
KYPETFQAAFGSADGGEVTEAEAKSAMAKAGLVVNRIRKATGCSFDYAWNMTRDVLPRVFNRMVVRKSSPRSAAIFSDKKNRQFGAKLFNALTRAEKMSGECSDESALATVRNRHPGLAGFVSGRLSLSEAFREEPGLALRFSHRD